MHLDSHLGGEDGIFRDKLQTLVRSSDVKGVVRVNLTLGEELTGRNFKDGNEAVVEFQMPGSFFIEVNPDLLEGDILSRKCPASTSNERA